MYLIDSDVLIDHLRQAKLIDESLKGILRNPSNFYISTLSEMEIWSGLSTRDKETSEAVQSLLDLFHKISPDSSICKLAGIYRRDYKLSPVDSIIAATAVIHQFTLVTKNKKHYQEISHLKIGK